jgi:hypothetical protein
MTDQYGSELRALDVEFERSTTMTVEMFSAKQAKIKARPPAPPAAALAPGAPFPALATPGTDSKLVVTFGSLSHVLDGMTTKIKSLFVEDRVRITALEARIVALEARPQTDLGPKKRIPQSG